MQEKSRKINPASEPGLCTLGLQRRKQKQSIEEFHWRDANWAQNKGAIVVPRSSRTLKVLTN
jgi:hypothetical protein